MKLRLAPALIALLAFAYLAAAQGESGGLNPDFTILPNTNPDPLSCPPVPPVDLDRDLTVTWGPEVQLTNWHKNSWVPRVAAWENSVHVVWKTEGVLNGERIFGRSSLNGGYTWNSFEFVASRESNWRHPAIAVWGSRRYATFRTSICGTGFTKNLNNARIWEQPPVLLIEGGWHPAISAWSNYVNVVAQVSTYLGGLVAHCISYDGGDSFSPVDTLALIPGGGGSIQPVRMVAFQNYVYLAYTFFWASTSTQEIFFQRSTDYGQSFEPFVMISTAGMTHSQCPSLACTANGDVYVAWMDYKYSPGPWGDILLRRSPNFGEQWEEEIIVTFHHLAISNAIAARDSQVHVIYEKDYPSGFPYDEMDIAYRYSNNLGQSWSTESWICQAHDRSQGPDLVQLGDTLHAVWSDERDIHPNIYYRRAAITQSRVTLSSAFDGISQKANKALSISPNPFNATTTLFFDLTAAGRVKILIYDNSGRPVAELVNGWREAGRHQVTFDASGLPSGIYIYRLQAADFSTSGKMVLIK